jgi:hypothetical protein
VIACPVCGQQARAMTATEEYLPASVTAKTTKRIREIYSHETTSCQVVRLVA